MQFAVFVKKNRAIVPVVHFVGAEVPYVQEILPEIHVIKCRKPRVERGFVVGMKQLLSIVNNTMNERLIKFYEIVRDRREEVVKYVVQGGTYLDDELRAVYVNKLREPFELLREYLEDNVIQYATDYDVVVSFIKPRYINFDAGSNTRVNLATENGVFRFEIVNLVGEYEMQKFEAYRRRHLATGQEEMVA